jgi:tRNA dimethylallyltransferase
MIPAATLPEPFQNALVLTGPTGSGKSHLGLEIGERMDAEIVSMDSMALYRGMDIGTAKPTREDRGRVPHHLIDVLDPWESASVAWWRQQAAACCRDIESRGRRVLFVGGTPLYLKALLRGIFDGPPADLALRAKLEAEAAVCGLESLHGRLARVDQAAAARIHPNDLRRVVRALEVWELTGRPISAWQVQWQQTAPPTATEMPKVLWLELPRDELYARIDARVELMMAAGFIDEARALRQLPRPLSREAAQALGSQEVFDHLDGNASLAETVARIQLRSRQFAKRQLTWFRRLPECVPATRELTFRAWRLTMG